MPQDLENFLPKPKNKDPGERAGSVEYKFPEYRKIIITMFTASNVLLDTRQMVTRTGILSNSIYTVSVIYTSRPHYNKNTDGYFDWNFAGINKNTH
jgi:hypothetical protein